jgi:tetratricopeptide (TPR) repeat protein
LALRINPDNPYAYYYRGMILAESEKYDQAIADFSQAIAINNQIPAIYEERAESYTKLENKDAAKKDYQEAIKLYKKLGKDLKAQMLQRKIGGVKR